jgi:hypothetical protein
MSYYHSELGATPIPPSPVYVREAISLPRPTNIREVYENILKLSEMKSLGQLDVAMADSLINDQRVVLNAMVDEAKLLAAAGNPNQEQRIIIEGGLPTLRGCEGVIMPHQLNGNASDGLLPKVIEHSPDPQTHPPEEEVRHSDSSVRRLARGAALAVQPF